VHAAQGSTTFTNRYDSLLPEQNYASVHAGLFLDLLDAENNFRQSGNMNKMMSKLLRIAGMKKTVHNNTLRTRLLLDLANISTRLKMYPLAVKCYAQAIRIKREKESAANIAGQNIADTTNYLRLIIVDTLEIAGHSSLPLMESLPVLSADIQSSFQDGKIASSYAIIVHVKQPVPGKRKAFCHINNVGHAFITLVKLNNDNSSVSRSFGFYPAKKSFLSATPVHPDDKAVIKDDALHPWDETVAKLISEKKFNRILYNLEKFGRSHYNLNRNNCTDFGLSEALIAGINIQETTGRWPLGKGNNPANAGQSLLEKKYENQDAEYPETFSINESQVLFDDSN
jgi:tetratricopeptide (TPR) repeat protein